MTTKPTTRDCSRCVTCGKRLAFLGPPRPIPCPENATDPSACGAVLDTLMTGRRATRYTGNALHPETVALMERSGWTIERLDEAIEEANRTIKHESELRYMPEAQALTGWIGGSQTRGLIAAKYALDAIDISAGGTRTIPEMSEASEKIARAIKEHAEDLWNKDWEFDDIEEPDA